MTPITSPIFAFGALLATAAREAQEAKAEAVLPPR
jgi:hypothetical protein